jgi:hypothetical protein
MHGAHALSDYGEMRYKKSIHNAVDRLRVLWKSMRTVIVDELNIASKEGFDGFSN